jgi:hypothetical protein
MTPQPHRFARRLWLPAALALALAACGPPAGTPRRTEASEVAAGHPEAARLWPALLQHCLRNPDCDPMSRFSEGAGEASGVVGSATWFAAIEDAPGEGRILISLHGLRGQGGARGGAGPRSRQGRRRGTCVRATTAGAG